MMLAHVVRLQLGLVARTPPSVPPPPLAEVRVALVRAERLVAKAPPAPVSRVVVKRLPPPAKASAIEHWDPEPLPAFAGPSERVTRDEELLLQEINGCKTLLLEVIRRASYDWVLYRHSRRLLQKVLAEQAYRWLFTEVPGSPEWQEREREGKQMTGFVAICEGLDLDPDKVRQHIHRLTPRNVMSVGRPAEYRRRDVFSSGPEGDVYSLSGAVLPYEDADDSREL